MYWKGNVAQQISSPLNANPYLLWKII